MNKHDEARVNGVTLADDGSIVVAIMKYNGIECLFHSFYGIICLILMAGTILAIVYGLGFWALVPGLLCLFCWGGAWLKSNDRLKERVYLQLLEAHLLKCGMITEPFMAKRFNIHADTIECINGDGKEQLYKVEFIQEQLPLYVVKIHLQHP